LPSSWTAGRRTSDFSREFDWGRISAGVSGTKATKSNTNFGTFVDELRRGTPAATAASYLGFDKGGFSSRMTLNYTGRYRDANATNTGRVGTDIEPFKTVNLAANYQFDGDSILGGTTLRFGVDNLFEATPQVIRRSTPNFIGYANWTLGRVFKFGISKKF
jgi:iron complex outermembrane recepter protein